MGGSKPYSGSVRHDLFASEDKFNSARERPISEGIGLMDF